VLLAEHLERRVCCESLVDDRNSKHIRYELENRYCTKTINSLGGVTVTKPNEILVSLTGPGTCDTPKKYSLMLLNVPRVPENSDTQLDSYFQHFRGIYTS